MAQKKASMLQAKTLAWVEGADGKTYLPVIWFGCVSGMPAHLMVGLREGANLPDGGICLGKFSLCLMMAPPGATKTPEKDAGAHTVRLNCRDGMLLSDRGAVTLSGCLDGLTVGQRTFSAAQVDVGRFLAINGRADA